MCYKMVKKKSKVTRKKKESDEPYTIANKKATPVLKPKVGKLEIDDYENILTLVKQAKTGYKQLSAQWSKWATIQQKIEKKIEALHKTEMNKLDKDSKPSKKKV